MQALIRGASRITRCHYRGSNLHQSWSHPVALVSSSSGEGGDHDDFWTSVKNVAETTKAYREAADPGTEANPWDLDAKVDGRVDNFISSSKQVQERSSSPDQLGVPREDPRSSGLAQEVRSGNQTSPRFDLNYPMNLSPVKKVDVKRFQGALLVDIRQYFKAEDGTTRPTTKGISLTVPQYMRLKACLDIIDSRLRESGGDL